MDNRMCFEQRTMMFAFMQKHEDLACDCISGPDAARVKKQLTEELAAILNAVGFGFKQTPDQWLKTWQDWTSGTSDGPYPEPLMTTTRPGHRRQFSRMGMVEGQPGVADPLQTWQDWTSGTSGGPCRVPLMTTTRPGHRHQFFRMEMVEGRPGVADPLQVFEDSPLEKQIQEEPSVPETPQQSRSHPDPLHAIRLRQAAAIENLATGAHSIAAALRQIAAALQPKTSLPPEEG